MKLLLILALVLAVWGAVAQALRLRFLAAMLWLGALFTLVVIASLWH